MFKSQQILKYSVAAILSASFSIQLSAQQLSPTQMPNVDKIKQMFDRKITDEKVLCSADLNGVSKDEMSEVLTQMYYRDIDISAAERLLSHRTGYQRYLSSKGPAQVVYLDFEVGSPFFDGSPIFPFLEGVEIPDYVYSQAEKNEIQRRLEEDFKDFNIVFTQEEPRSGDFLFLQFNSNDNPGETAGLLGDGGILFGRADEIDFGNNNRNSGAIVDANIWTLLSFVDPSGEFLAEIAGLPFNQNSDPAELLSQAIINQSANTGAHEIGHTFGLRHYDSFGAPGEGLPSTGFPTRDEFFPSYDGRQSAVETVDHTMATGASVGITLADGAGKDRFFSERSLLKLSINDRVGSLLDSFFPYIVQQDQLPASGRLLFRPLRTPNNLVTGLNADTQLRIRNSVVEGSIDELDEVHQFRFFVPRGSVLSAEVISDVDLTDDFIFPRVRLYRENRRNGSLTLLAENISEFESRDSFLLDFDITRGGTYVIEVDAQDIVQLANDDGSLSVVSFDEFDAETQAFFRLGDYTLNVYAVENQF